MLKRKVVAADITNLTDARYFAARGVDYMHYDLKNIGINEIMAIAEWVEGVNTLVQVENENIHLIEEMIMRTSPYAIGTEDKDCLERILQYSTSDFIFFDFAKNEFDNRKIIITEKESVDPTSFQIDSDAEKEAYSEIDPSLENLKKFLKISEAGIILRGSFEEETGLKSYDNMDILFEYLEND